MNVVSLLTKFDPDGKFPTKISETSRTITVSIKTSDRALAKDQIASLLTDNNIEYTFRNPSPLSSFGHLEYSVNV